MNNNIAKAMRGSFNRGVTLGLVVGAVVMTIVMIMIT